MRPTSHKVLITGGTRGIGHALMETFVGNGNDVVIIGRTPPNALPSQVCFIACDLSSRTAREELITTMFHEHPDLSVLINNAGVQHEGEFGVKWHANDYAQEISVNIEAVIHLTDGLLPLLREKSEAAIVNVSSALSIQPKQDSPVYCATKAFIRSFSQSLSYQLEQSNVQVLDLVPPLVDTQMTQENAGSKIKPDALAQRFWRGWLKNEKIIYVGQARALQIINRISPRLAAKIVRR